MGRVDSQPPPSSEVVLDGKALLLNVDDSDGSRYARSRALRRAGFEVLEASSGLEALDVAHLRKPDIALLDVGLPDLNGIEVSRRLKGQAETSSMLILQISASSVEDRHRVAALNSGADSFLVEPVDEEVLIASVNALLRLRRAEQALLQSQTRLELAFEAGRLCPWDWDVGADLIAWSEGTCLLIGLEREQLPSTLEGFLGLVHPEDRERVSRVVVAVLHAEERFDLEHRIVRGDGAVRWISDTGRVLRDETGRPVRVTGLLCDITERKRVEEALRAADRRKDDFLATLAHELRNTLAPVLSGVQILKLKGTADPLVAEQEDVIERQVLQLRALLDDLLDISRITRGKLELRKERVELGQVFQHALETSRPLMEARGHRFSVELPPEPLWVDAAPSRLAQVFTNLLNNAAKYTEPGGKVLLHVERSGPQVVAKVTDTGIGMAPEFLERVFDLYSQADRSLEWSQGGLGLGLTLVRSLVELHGGNVSAWSAGPRQGSEFTVRLPLAEAPAVAPRPLTPPRQTAPPRPMRILVVDDNPHALKSLATLLGLWGHEVRAVQDGPSAVAEAASFRPELVLLDLGLPGMDGYQVQQALTSQDGGRRARLVALTGHGTEEDRRRSSRAGFHHHLIKPVDWRDLMQCIECAASEGEIEDGVGKPR